MAYRDIIKTSDGKKPLVVFSSVCMTKTGPPDCHVANEISLFRGGSGIYRINGKNYEFKSDNIFLMPSNVTHAIVKVDSPTYFYNIYFEPRLIWDSNNFFDKKYLQVFRGNLSKYPYMVDRHNPCYNDVLEIFEKILYEYSQREKGYQHMVKGHLLTLLVSLYRYFDYGSEDDIGISKYVINAVGHATDYIDDNFCTDISLEDIAQSANLSPTYFGIVFKKLNGMTPWDYVSSKRIRYAIEKITNGEPTLISQIAAECGFNNTANFNRAFKKYTGMVPSQCCRNTTDTSYAYDDTVVENEEVFCDFYE